MISLHDAVVVMVVQELVVCSAPSPELLAMVSLLSVHPEDVLFHRNKVYSYVKG